MAGFQQKKKVISNHLTYSWWKYLILVIVCVLGVDIVFTTTAYRVPEDKKIELYMLNGYADGMAMHAELWPAFSDAYPEQEELLVQNINILSSDMYAYMQFSTYVAAQQGDVCVMPVTEVKKLAAEGAEGAFLELTPFVESGVIDPQDIDLTEGYMRSSEGIEGLYAIPADSLYGLLRYGTDPADSMLCIMAYNGNDEHAAAMVDMLIERYRTEKPEGYDEVHEKSSAPAALF